MVASYAEAAQMAVASGEAQARQAAARLSRRAYSVRLRVTGSQTHSPVTCPERNSPGKHCKIYYRGSALGKAWKQKTVKLQFFTAEIEEEDICFWLSRHCESALYLNQTEWWASIKDRTKGFFQQAGKWQAFFHRRQHERLTRKLQALPRQAAVGWDVREDIREAKAQIGAWYREKARKKIFQEEHQQLEREWTLEEVKKTLQGFKNSKTPGLAGLPKEFYMIFWDLVGPNLLELFQE
ncbi:hypothetical protein Y1Q_0010287 [Alligator mississippiensis]|uniref:Uncharacterized protein n=1 Tax=Alligator mississippiensis TaxID=8496 RepID=A0A151NM06_ALLMI|nr:hypothetical protein Y1Q_0010287 [Alligator mississippiensis]